MVAAFRPTNEVEAGSSASTFEAVYEAYRHRVYRWALRYGAGNSEWAEDLTHDVFLKALERLATLDDPGDLGGWLYRVTANLAISRLRRERSIFSRVLARYRAGREETAGSPQATLELKQEAGQALEALQALPDKERVVISMTILDGKSQREIARELSLSEGYVSKLLKRAWERLRAAGWEAGDD